MRRTSAFSKRCFRRAHQLLLVLGAPETAPLTGEEIKFSTNTAAGQEYGVKLLLDPSKPWDALIEFEDPKTKQTIAGWNLVYVFFDGPEFKRVWWISIQRTQPEEDKERAIEALDDRFGFMRRVWRFLRTPAARKEIERRAPKGQLGESVDFTDFKQNVPYFGPEKTQRPEDWGWNQ